MWWLDFKCPVWITSRFCFQTCTSCFRIFFENQLICHIGSRYHVYLLNNRNSEVEGEGRGVAKSLWIIVEVWGKSKQIVLCCVKPLTGALATLWCLDNCWIVFVVISIFSQLTLLLSFTILAISKLWVTKEENFEWLKNKKINLM